MSGSLYLAAYAAVLWSGVAVLATGIYAGARTRQRHAQLAARDRHSREALEWLEQTRTLPPLPVDAWNPADHEITDRQPVVQP